MSRSKPTKSQQKSIEDFRRYLNKYYSVPTKVFDGFRETLIYYAVTEADWLKYDRIYSGVAIMLWRRYRLSGPEILEGLKTYDAICGSVLNKDENGEDVANWHDLMVELRDNTGIVIHTGDDNRLVCECEWEEEEEEDDGTIPE